MIRVSGLVFEFKYSLSFQHGNEGKQIFILLLLQRRKKKNKKIELRLKTENFDFQLNWNSIGIGKIIMIYGHQWKMCLYRL